MQLRDVRSVTARFHFGRCELRPETRELLVDGVVVPIGGRAFDLLSVFVGRPDEVLSKDELYELVWAGTAVEPNNLQVQIWTLRKVLGRQSIVTVSRRGYRFTPYVRVSPHVAHSLHSDAANPPLESLVKPADDPGNSYAANDGLEAPEELLASLMQRHRLLTFVDPDEGQQRELARRAGLRLSQRLGAAVLEIDAEAMPHSLERHGVTKLLATSRSSAGRFIDIVSRLRRRKTFLVLRGAEQLGPASRASMRELVVMSPHLHVLALSKTALNFPGERVFTVPFPRRYCEVPRSACCDVLRWRSREE